MTALYTVRRGRPARKWSRSMPMTAAQALNAATIADYLEAIAGSWEDDGCHTFDGVEVSEILDAAGSLIMTFDWHTGWFEDDLGNRIDNPAAFLLRQDELDEEQNDASVRAVVERAETLQMALNLALLVMAERIPDDRSDEAFGLLSVIYSRADSPETLTAVTDLIDLTEEA